MTRRTEKAGGFGSGANATVTAASRPREVALERGRAVLADPLPGERLGRVDPAAGAAPAKRAAPGGGDDLGRRHDVLRERQQVRAEEPAAAFRLDVEPRLPPIGE